MPGPPIRKPSDHSPPAGSPRNIAGHHVLHRPLMPRHPPNAQKNKQQTTHDKTKNFVAENTYSKMLASTIQFTTNPPTPTPHHPSNRQQKHGPGNQGALPQNPDSMPPPTHAGGTHHHPTGQQRACFLHHTQPTTPTAQNRRNQPAMHSNLRARHPSTGRPGPHWPRQDKQPKKGGGKPPHTNTQSLERR